MGRNTGMKCICLDVQFTCLGCRTWKFTQIPHLKLCKLSWSKHGWQTRGSEHQWLPNKMNLGRQQFHRFIINQKNQPVNLQGCSVHCSVLQWHQEIHIKNQYFDLKHVLVNFWAWIPVSLLTKYGFCSSLQILELLSRRFNGVYYLVYLESVLATCKNIEKRKFGNYGGTVT